MDAAGARALKRRIEQYQAARRLGLAGAHADGHAAEEPAPQAAEPATPASALPLEAWIGSTREVRPAS